MVHNNFKVRFEPSPFNSQPKTFAIWPTLDIINNWYCKLYKYTFLKILHIINLLHNLGIVLLHTTNDNQLFFSFSLCFHMVFDNSSLFMSMPNLIWININIMDMKVHILFFCFSYTCWWVGKKNVVIRKKWRNYYFLNAVVRFWNEVVDVGIASNNV
jgi:hypothetical protein